jgi:murein DD-endopeptidase MepM/ murein hydrolase activator NlpD
VWAAPTILQIRDFYRDCIEDIPLLTRIASHVGLLFMIVLSIAASSIQLNNIDKNDSTTSSPTSDTEIPVLTNDIADDGFLFQSPIPVTNIPKRARREVQKYAVQPGDTVSDIGDQFEVGADSILWANPKLEDNPDMLSVGQVLNIPPVSGVLYTVQTGDTLQKIAEKFKGRKTVDAIIQNIVSFEFNQEHHALKPPDYPLAVGQFLMVPGGYKPYVPRVVYAYSGPIPASAARGTGHFGWPVSGRVTQKYWARHLGLDIGAPKGSPVYAADSGYVVRAGWDPTGYGFMLLITHGNGYTTRYAHLSTMNVEVGESVKKGQLIARVGSTGNSTGPHLHFEIIWNGVHRNPFGLLPGR